MHRLRKQWRTVSDRSCRVGIICSSPFWATPSFCIFLVNAITLLFGHGAALTEATSDILRHRTLGRRLPQ